MTSLRESVSGELERKIRGEFTDGIVGTVDMREDSNTVEVANLHGTPEEVWHRLVCLLDGLSEMSPSTQFKIDVMNCARMEIAGRLSDHKEAGAKHAIVTIAYGIRESAGKLMVSLSWPVGSRD